jgi:hypothetical protein
LTALVSKYKENITVASIFLSNSGKKEKKLLQPRKKFHQTKK